jgi:hypothetical protein
LLTIIPEGRSIKQHIERKDYKNISLINLKNTNKNMKGNSVWEVIVTHIINTGIIYKKTKNLTTRERQIAQCKTNGTE